MIAKTKAEEPKVLLTVRQDGDIDYVDRQVIEWAGRNGKICEIYGHWWRDEDAVGLTCPPTHFRYCKICSVRQVGREQEMITWTYA